MPSLLHEAILELFRNRPSLAAELLRDAFDVALPEHEAIELESPDLSEVTPAEYRADLALKLSSGGVVRLGVIVEAQLRRDPTKRFTWAVYVAVLRSKLGCPVLLVVVAPDAGVAEWCRKPIDLGGGCILRPIVVGPESVPVVTDTKEAERAPELAVLSVMAHGKEEVGAEIARAVIEAADTLDEDRAKLYVDLAMISLAPAARAALEALMRPGYEYQSDFARKYVAQGRAEGRAEGEARGLREAVLDVLAARGIAVSTDVVARIEASTEIAELRALVARAAKATTIDDLLD